MGRSSYVGAARRRRLSISRAREGRSSTRPRISQAWEAARRWMATTRSVRVQIRAASRAAIVPMLTLSWLWDSVEREKEAAGMVALRASAVRAEAEVDMALNPWW